MKTFFLLHENFFCLPHPLFRFQYAIGDEVCKDFMTQPVEMTTVVYKSGFLNVIENIYRIKYLQVLRFQLFYLSRQKQGAALNVGLIAVCLPRKNLPPRTLI
jgi:hypothetical protein